MRRVKVALIIPILFLFLGCAANQKVVATAAYESAGKVLIQMKATGEELCKTVKPEDCTQMKKIYNDTRLAYLIAGDTLVVAINVDSVEALSTYNQMSADLSKLFLNWIAFLKSLGVVKGGAK